MSIPFPSRKRRYALAVTTTVVLCSVFALSMRPSEAAAQCNGTNCLPGSGYTWDRSWNCGLIYDNQDCFQPGNCLSVRCADLHTFGWGSADYDGGGRIFVNVFLGGGQAPRGALGGGFNLARTCYRNDCNDQDSYAMYGFVSWGTSGSTARHTIIGSGKA